MQFKPKSYVSFNFLNVWKYISSDTGSMIASYKLRPYHPIKSHQKIHYYQHGYIKQSLAAEGKHSRLGPLAHSLKRVTNEKIYR